MQAPRNDTQEPILDQVDYDLQYSMAKRDEVVSLLNAHFFEVILPDLRGHPHLSDSDHHVYCFPDREGRPLRIDVLCRLSPNDIMQTPGFRALQQYCDAHGWRYELTHFYHRTDAVEADKFVMRFSDYYAPLTQSFQLLIQGRPPGHPLPERSAVEGGK